MVKVEWGVKRTCQSCHARFYDLRKSPIVCPKCQTTFEIQTTTRGRRSKVSEIEKLLPLEFQEVDDVVIGLDEDLDDSLEDGLIDDSDIDEDLGDTPDFDKKEDDH